jgi:hypothetical protein
MCEAEFRAGRPAVGVGPAIGTIDQAQPVILDLPNSLRASPSGFWPKLDPEPLFRVEVRGVEIIVQDQ